jgi:hypothetical protein
MGSSMLNSLAECLDSKPVPAFADLTRYDAVTR